MLPKSVSPEELVINKAQLQGNSNLTTFPICCFKVARFFHENVQL